MGVLRFVFVSIVLCVISCYNDCVIVRQDCIITLSLRQNGRHFPDDIFKCIFLNENDWISIKISLNFVPWGPINNILALVQIMAWRRWGDKPLSEPMMVSLLMHICITRPQWVMMLRFEELLWESYDILHDPAKCVNKCFWPKYVWIWNPAITSTNCLGAETKMSSS